MSRKTPPSAWENGLHEAIKRLGEFIVQPTTKAEILSLPDRLDARDQGALAYVLWRLRDAPDSEPHEPHNGPGRMTEEQKARLTKEERIFFGLDDT